MTTRRPKKPLPLGLKGSLWLTSGQESVGGHGRIALLRAVAEHGSITQAAKAFGMGYKAAWTAINTMNALSGTPLVERVTGGRGGGSTRLTEQGRRLVERYGLIDAVHQRFLRLLDQGTLDLTQEFSLLKVLNMKTSARNQWLGTVSAIRAGAVNDEVELSLTGGARLSVIVTRESTEALALQPQQTVIALVKASSVVLATELGDARLSARNRFEGRVRSVTTGAVNAEVVVDAQGGLAVVAIVVQSAVADLGLAPDAPVTVLVKASDVILTVAS
ncbi:MAG: molybdate transport system regulatory protein [Hydrogenophaga sp.]|jgi:molybdate transport system regulatory protein